MNDATNILNEKIAASINVDSASLRIVIAGGGTGGHIFPAIAIANALKKIKPQAEFLFVGAKGKMEMEKVPQAGYEIRGLDIAGFNRSSLIKNIGLPFKIIKSFFQVSTIFKQFKPDVVIGVGGYSSYPVLRYAQSKNIPTFIHESNSFAGKSNILLGKKAVKIFTASDAMQQFFAEEKIILTGNPVRQAISHNTVTKELALNYFGLDQHKKTVLVVGGSLGAKSINETIGKNLASFGKNNLQLIWQTGMPYFEKATVTVKDVVGIYMKDFITQMEYAYAAADIVISRSGAMAVAELCLAKKVVIFVPYPFAAEDHQTANANALVNKEAAIMIEDADAMNELMPALLKLCAEEKLQKIMAENIGALAVNNADEIIALQILKAINRA